MLPGQLSCPLPEFRWCEISSVVDPYGGPGKHPGCLRNTPVLIISNPSRPQVIEINVGAHREQALNDLVFVHFSAEEPNATLIRRCCIERYTRGETYLTNQRWREQDEHVRRRGVISLVAGVQPTDVNVVKAVPYFLPKG